MKCSIFKNRIVIVLVCLIAGAFISRVPKNLTLCTTDSVKYSLFWTTPYNMFDGQKLMNKYIRLIIDIDLKNAECKQCQILKRVGCDSLSRIEVKDKQFICDGSIIGETHREDFIVMNGIIPEDKIFLIGDHEKSYDSRYFGLVEKSKINAILLPLF
jgi:signal peptidase I/conjugal transfer pilin signal peptidase TrbI